MWKQTLVIAFMAMAAHGLTMSLQQPPSTRRAFFRDAVALSSAVVVTVGGGSSSNPAYADSSPVASTNSVTLGKKAPKFELPNSRGNGSTSLGQLTKSGKWTVLYFYPGAFSKGCTLEARGFQKDIDQYRKLNTQIVGVSVDPVAKNAQFCSAESLDFFMLSDTSGKVSQLYGSALSIPGFGTFSNRQTYLIDPRGNVRWIFTDVESRIPQHSKEVLDKLQELV